MLLNIISSNIYLDRTLIIALIRYIVGFAGTVAVYLMLKKIFTTRAGNNFANLKLIQYIGQNTLGLYLFQSPLIVAVLLLGKKWINLSSVYEYSPIISVLVILFLIMIVVVVRKSRLCTLLLLGENKKMREDK